MALFWVMEAVKKVTVHLPEKLLEEAQGATGLGITQTIRKGLEFIAASRAYEKLRRLKGKVRFSFNLKRLREDRT